MIYLPKPCLLLKTLESFPFCLKFLIHIWWSNLSLLLSQWCPGKIFLKIWLKGDVSCLSSLWFGKISINKTVKVIRVIKVLSKRRRSGRADKSVSMFSSTVVGSSLARGVTSYPRKNSTNIEGDDMMISQSLLYQEL